ncbi:MAG: hypothetical protein GEV09_18910 [Pseudonocardiaceae bacterium]|nr:hypothetical protein [Pseudonocardiaceae bacterium]
MRFGRPDRSADPGRHRNGEQRGADLTPDAELDSYLSAISPARGARDSDDPTRGFSPARVHQLQLPADADEQVQRLAERRGTTPLRLLHEWVLQRLDDELGGEGAPHR